ncbi:MAG: Flp pilus assembly complex ATPase component TadA [Gemmatimonadota bacterium]|nr:Flp pilus assembly complex ATPase component TadA [Gemmatimonadota bacterium]
MTATSILDLPPADFSRIDPRAVALLAERWARRHRVVPLSVDGGTIVVATSDPLDLDAERAVAFATGHRVRWEVAASEEIAHHLDRIYPEAPSRRDPVAPPIDVQHLSFSADNGSSGNGNESGSSIIRLVDQLIAEAIRAGASDLHLEPEEQGIAVRHRVDGVIRQVRVLPRYVAPSLVSRVKILSGLDIADRMRPQDGRARVAVFGSVVDLRVSTLPVSHGEKIVIRVLDGTAGLRTLEAIGFATEDLVRIRRLLECREGLVLVTGPTGSGKTTTLYAALREIQARGVNVVTVEDPIEYRLPGVVQVQVHEKAGLTFGAALRSIVRQDPDVILVGEIRDKETAEIAIQASLTGHLVLSTLHTNDAASAVTRLIDIGVASYQIATAVKGVVAQRLVRRVCPECSSAGCAACEGAGYRGRRAIAEILTTSPEFERQVAAGAPTESLAAAARAAGCTSLWDSGLALVQKGETTMEELRRVAAAPVRMVSEAARAIEPAMRTLQHGWPPDDQEPTLVSRPIITMATVNIGTIDVILVDRKPDGWKVLTLQRAIDTRCPGAWETVHGRIEAGEEPEDAAIREVREETGLAVERLYNVTVQPFYLHKLHVVELAVVFAAFVDSSAPVTLGDEHSKFEWLDAGSAAARFFWPRERAALQEVLHLFRTGDGGEAEDVLRVR